MEHVIEKCVGGDECKKDPKRKRAGSDWIIENDGSRAELEARVDALWAQLQTLPPRPPDPPLPQQASRTDTTC